MDTAATIIAVSSPPGRALHGLIRLSGASAADAVNTCLERPIDFSCRGVHHARFVLNQSRSTSLPVLVMNFPAPSSYTGEHVIELRCPGSPPLLNRIIQELIERYSSEAGHVTELRRAEPGEFTARAYWRGRLTLTQAEGVAAAIAARSDEQLAAARLLLSESFGQWARTSGDELTALLGLVEAGIDFTDQEDVVAISPIELHDRITKIQENWNQWLGKYTAQEHHESIPWVVLTGPANAGKSTLFNALLGRTRAVSSATKGTTRDVLAEPLTVPGPTSPTHCMLVDVAGWDKRVGELDAQMQLAANSALERATVQIACLAADHDCIESDGVINVRTMIDQVDEADLSNRAKSPIGVSALSGAGIETLRARIGHTLAQCYTSPMSEATGLVAKHRQALDEANAALAEAASITAVSQQDRHLQDAELVAAALRDALDAMKPLIGQVDPDDVLDHVFAHFCVGK